MALKWYYCVPYAAAYSSASCSITPKDSNKRVIISRPRLFNGEEYGTEVNKAYSINFNVSGTVSGRDIRAVNYKLTKDYTDLGLGGYDCRCYVVGADENDINISGSTYINVYDNAKIKGKWRVHNTLVKHNEKSNCGNYLIRVPHTITLKNGTVYSNFELGNNTDELSDNELLFSFGNINIGTTSYVDQVEVSSTYKDMVVDFGELEQNVPSFVKDFFTTNFDYIYPNIYTIKSPTGETLASISEQPPIVETNLIQAGSSYQLTLTLSDGTIQTLTWSYDTPEGYQFIGLGTSAFTGVTIPLGFNTTSIGESITLYPIFAPYRPQPDTFDINLYQNEAEYNRLDKTDYLRSVGTISGVLREAVSVTDLLITIESNTFPTFNYVYIDKFKRYYFVNDISILANNLYEIDLSVDPLMSYKDALLEMSAFVDRNEYLSNPRLIDKKRVIEQGVDLQVELVTNDVFENAFEPDTEVMYVFNGYKLGTIPTDVLPTQEVLNDQNQR